MNQGLNLFAFCKLAPQFLGRTAPRNLWELYGTFALRTLCTWSRPRKCDSWTYMLVFKKENKRHKTKQSRTAFWEIFAGKIGRVRNLRAERLPRYEPWHCWASWVGWCGTWAFPSHPEPLRIFCWEPLVDRHPVEKPGGALAAWKLPAWLHCMTNTLELLFQQLWHKAWKPHRNCGKKIAASL